MKNTEGISNKEKILKIIKEKNGYIAVSDLKEHNIPRVTLTRLVRENKIEKLDRGIYIEKSALDDTYYMYAIKYKKMVYSGWSALFLQKMTKQIYHQMEANFPRSYNTSKVKEKINCHRVEEWKLKLGIQKVKTMFGNYVYTYDRERIICDLILNLDKYDDESWIEAIKIYKNSKPNYKKLYEYAKALNVEKEIKLKFDLPW